MTDDPREQPRPGVRSGKKGVSEGTIPLTCRRTPAASLGADLHSG